MTELLGLERNAGIGTAITHMSLVLAKQGHLIDVLHCGHRREVEEPWATRYEAAGVNIRLLDRSIEVQPERVAMSWSAYNMLKHDDYDAIVFQDWLGVGAVSMLAKQAGTAFTSTTLIHHVHGPTEWLLEANRSVELDSVEAVLCHMERTSAELADVVVGPSSYLVDWMERRGWKLPERRATIPYFTAAHVDALDAPLQPDRDDAPLTELVFFGRLEERKGVRVFVESLNRLGPRRLSGLRVTFLGRPAHFGPEDVRFLIDDDVLTALDEVRFETDFDQPAARAYLQQSGRLAVMPSLMDNSPNVVYECIEDRVPFIASAAGGTAELVDPLDRDATMFDPTASALTDRLGAIVDDRRLPRPARPTFDGPSLLSGWKSVLEPRQQLATITETPLVSVVVPTHDRPRLLRQAVDSLARQHYPNLEIVVVDDGSTLDESLETLDRLESLVKDRSLTVVRQENRYLGAARNAGVRAATGDLIAFLDDDDLAAPEYVSTMVTAALHADADAVSCAFETIAGLHDDMPRPQDATGVWVYLGGPLSLAPLVNVLGGAGMLVRRAVFDKVGGFHEEHGIGHEDWQFLVKVALAGGRIVTVPEPLYRYRHRPGSMLRSGNAYENARVVNEAYLDVLPAELSGWPALLRGFHARVQRADGEIDRLHGHVDHLQRELDRRRRYVELLEKRRGRHD